MSKGTLSINSYLGVRKEGLFNVYSVSFLSNSYFGKGLDV